MALSVLAALLSRKKLSDSLTLALLHSPSDLSQSIWAPRLFLPLTILLFEPPGLSLPSGPRVTRAATSCAEL